MTASDKLYFILACVMCLLACWTAVEWVLERKHTALKHEREVSVFQDKVYQLSEKVLSYQRKNSYLRNNLQALEKARRLESRALATQLEIAYDKLAKAKSKAEWLLEINEGLRATLQETKDNVFAADLQTRVVGSVLAKDNSK